MLERKEQKLNEVKEALSDAKDDNEEKEWSLVKA